MTVKWNPFVRIDRELAKAMKLAKLSIKQNVVIDVVHKISSETDREIMKEIDREIMKDLLWASNAVSSL